MPIAQTDAEIRWVYREQFRVKGPMMIGTKYQPISGVIASIVLLAL
jgi:hypothetical protein